MIEKIKSITYQQNYFIYNFELNLVIDMPAHRNLTTNEKFLNFKVRQ